MSDNESRTVGLGPHAAQVALIASRAGERPGVNCTFVYQVSGALDQRRLVLAYEHALAAFDALRMVWSGHGHTGWWLLGDEPRIDLRCVDLRGDRLMLQGHPSEELISRLQQCSERPFDLSSGPVGRVEIWHVGARQWTVIEAFDHVLADGRSLSLLHEAVGRLYRNPAQPLRRYPSYAALLAVTSPHPESHAYWRAAFEGFEGASMVGEQAGASPAEWQLTLSAERAGHLERAAGRLRGTLASALCTAHAHAVARHLGTGDIATHVAIDSRSAEDLDVFGQMTALMPLRVRHEWSAELGRQVSAVTRSMLGMRDHLNVDIDALERLQVPVALSRPDSTAFIMQPAAAAIVDLPGAVVSAIALRSSDQVSGLATVARRYLDGTVQLSLRAPLGSHLADLIPSIGDTIDVTLRAIDAHPEIALGSDELLPRFCRTLIDSVGKPSKPYPFAPVDDDILTSLSALGPREILADDRTYFAHNLLERIHAVEQNLRDAEAGAGDAVLVGDLPAIDRIAAFVAILHMGSIYIPSDSSTLPATSAGYQIAARVSAEGVQPCSCPRSVTRTVGPQSPAYVIFTSGSTGRPKGVVVSRASLSNLVRGEADRFGLGATSRVLLVAPPTTDPWICHVAAALMAGATLVPGEAMTARPLAEQIRTGRVTHAFLPAALLRTLDTSDFPDLQMIATAGDSCRASDLATFSGVKVFNIYGPTEATVTATVAEILYAVDPVPIGRPIRGMGARVVIDRSASAPPNVPGELVLSGAGIALGYLGEEELTRKSFRSDPFSPHQRWYCTGDLARLGPDGQLVLGGRVDRQVKVRGSRIEPEAVESAARATSMCSGAYAKAYRLPSSLDALLVLFVEGCTNVDDFRKALRGRVPASAWPHHIATMKKLPRRPSGKVAEELLPDNYAQAINRARVQEAPTGVLGKIWADLFGVPPRPSDQFFDVGGDSLNALRFVRLAREADIDLSPADIYAHPLYSDLYHLCRERSRRSYTPAAAGTERTALLGPAQQWFLTMGFRHPHRWNQRHAIGFAALPDQARLENALTKLITVTPILRSAVNVEQLKFAARTATPVSVDILDASVPDQTLADAIDRLNREINHLSGAMLQAVAVRGEHGAGVLVLVAHHLVVDIWSWRVIEDRLLRILHAPPSAQIPGLADHGFALFAEAVARQRNAGAFNLDGDLWRQVLASGETTDLSARPCRIERTMRMIPAPGQLVRSWDAPASRIMLAALGDALHVTHGAGATVVDLERNGRAAISGLDLSDAVGWVALHHPVTLTHAPMNADTIHRICADIDAVPDFGLSYGALRWAGHSDLGNRVGRFAVDFLDHSSFSRTKPDEIEKRIKALPVTMTGDNYLPYQGTFGFRHGPEDFSVILDFDPDRVGPDQAAELLDALVDATRQRRPKLATRTRTRANPEFFARPIPASAMQRLMLHYTGSIPGAYIPRQILAIEDVRDPRDFLEALSEFIGALDPFRRRFRSVGTNILQTWLPPGQVAPVRHGEGGRLGALTWIDSADRITSQAVLRGESPVDLTGFYEDNTVFLAMEVHHALMDGVSNWQVIRLIDQFARLFPERFTMHSAAYQAQISRVMLRKHVSCEMAVGSWIAPKEIAPADTERPISRAMEISVTRLRRISGWAARHAVDLRAALAAIVGKTAQATLGADALHVVANGRDADIPGSSEALGMFWYFQEIPLLQQAIIDLAQTIYGAAAVPMPEIRSAAMKWPEWSAEGIAFNFTKQEALIDSGPLVQIVGRRDTFHFRTQIDIAVRSDGSGTVRCTATRDVEDVMLMLDTIAELLDRFGTDRQSVSTGKPADRHRREDPDGQGRRAQEAHRRGL